VELERLSFFLRIFIEGSGNGNTRRNSKSPGGENSCTETKAGNGLNLNRVLREIVAPFLLTIRKQKNKMETKKQRMESDELKAISKELQRINMLLSEALEKYPKVLELHEKMRMIDVSK